MYFELLFASLVVLTTVYMCHMINEGPGNFGYRRFHVNDGYDDDYADSSTESEFNLLHLGSPAHSPRSSRWSSTTFSSDEDDGEAEHDLISMDPPPPAESHTRAGSSRVPIGNLPTAESEITELEIEPLDSRAVPNHHHHHQQLLVTEPRHAVHAEVPWILNPLFQETAT